MQGFIIRFGSIQRTNALFFASFCVSAMQNNTARRKSACILLRFWPAKHAFLLQPASCAFKNAAVKTAASIKLC